MSVHERIHKNTLLPCQFCQYKSTREAHMLDHMDVHFNFLKYICDFCERKFVSHSLLHNHVNRYHERNCFQCKICSRKFHARDDVRKHIRRFHKMKGDCRIHISRPKFEI